jgi:hypothetical protein
MVGFARISFGSLLALANFLRLSLMKAAHANLFGAACRKSGSPVLFDPRTLRRTWGTRPVSVEVTDPAETVS